MHSHFINRIIILLQALYLLAIPLNAQEATIAPVTPSSETLQQKFGAKDRKAFLAPEKEFYPETWFHFIGGNVSYEGITADLEAIAEAGISGVHFFHGQFGGKWPATGEDITCMSEKWEDAVRFTADECRRLGLRFTMQNCPGWAMAGGPWIKSESAMRTIVSSEKIIKTSGNIETNLQIPSAAKEEWRNYKEIAVLAFPTPEGASEPVPVPSKIDSKEKYDWSSLILKGKELTLPAGGNTHTVIVDYGKPTIIRTMELSPIQTFNHAMSYGPEVRIRMFAIDSRGGETKVIDAPMPASNWQDGANMSIACNEVSDATRYRIEITNEYSMRLRHLRLLALARKNSWESEAAWTLRAFERTADDVIQSEQAYLDPKKIIDVTVCMDSTGLFLWKAPHAGEWTIMRIGHVNAGQKNGPAPPSGTGWECDKLSNEGAEVHFSGYIGHLTSDALKGERLKGLLLDSWECRVQTWTNRMEKEFNKHNGYDLRQWLPSIFGYVIDCPETTSRFLLDWRSTINELFANRFYKRISELGREAGLSVLYETAAGDVFPGDIMEYFKYADVPMCEFWHPFSNGYVGDLDFKPIKPTASAARLYGKPRVNAESFTSFNLTWDERWEMLKEVADFNAVEGVTHNVFHTYTHNPQIDYLKPGTSFGSRIGTPFLRGQTWWRHMREFTTYLARCSYMLERGKPISDILWYLGDEISHKPSQKLPFPEGYRFDYCNPDILLNRLSVEDGRIVTPEGLSYRAIWIPENKRMLPQTLERLHNLMEEGAYVIASAPKGIATLSGGKRAQRRFNKAVDAIWGKALSGKIKRIGKGGILSGTSIEDAIATLSLPADVKGNGIRWIHRRTEGADFYFVTPMQGKSFDGKVEFHATGETEIWNPVNGDIYTVENNPADGYTSIDLSLPKGGSCFVVIHNGTPAEKRKICSRENEKRISGDWTITFPEGWGAPDTLITKELKPWNSLELPEEAKAFSGTATYKTTFIANSEMFSVPLTLDIGKVNMIAAVKVNGKSAGTLWCAPYSLDISKYIKEGENELVIEVTSTWYNRLVYDASLPEEKRKTWTIVGPSANSPLRECGLMGPVRLIY